MRIIEGEGQLRHHFHLEYSATIAIWFESAEDAALAQRTFLTDWKPIDEHPYALIWHGSGAEWTATKDLLESLGAVDFDGCQRSIDFGLPFTIEIAV